MDKVIPFWSTHFILFLLMKQIWSSVRVYTCSRDEFYDALQHFISNHDPKAALLQGMNTVSPMVGSGGYLGALGSSLGLSSNPKSLMADVMGALGGYTSVQRSETISRVASLPDLPAASNQRHWILPVLYDGKKPANGTFGKLDTLPLTMEFGGPMSYTDIVSLSPPADFRLR